MHLHVNWLLHGTPKVASSRLHGYEVHRFLRSRGLESELLMAPPLVSPDVPWEAPDHPMMCRLLSGSIVVFQKLFGPNTEGLLRALHGAGVPTVYIHCDYQPENELPFLADVVVCPSRYLAEHYRAGGQSEVVVIDDPVEYWVDRRVIIPSRPDWGRVRLCWVGVDHNWDTLAPLRAILREPEFADFELVTMSNHPDATVPWRLETVPEVVASCEVGVVPVGSGPASLAKSSNRVTLFMALGKPVVAGRLPAYSEVVESGRNGFLCDEPEEWRVALRSLRDAETRRAVALRAYDDAAERYHMRVVGERWIELFRGLAPVDRGAGDLRPSLVDGLRRARVRALAQLGYAGLAIERQDYTVAIESVLDAIKYLPLAPSVAGRVFGMQRRLPRRALVSRALRRSLNL